MEVAHFSATVQKKYSSDAALNQTRISGFVGGRFPSELAGPGCSFSFSTEKLREEFLFKLSHRTTLFERLFNAIVQVDFTHKGTSKLIA